MSEFLAEARIIVRPDTARFRADLEAQLRSVVARPIKIPVIPVVGPGFAAAAAASGAFAAAQAEAAAATTVNAEALAAATTIQRQYTGVVDLSTVATQASAAAKEKDAIASVTDAAAQTKLNQARAQGLRGVIAQGAALLGLRAGTLAASSAFIGGTVAVLAFAKAVQSAASLETELNVFKVTAGATADQMARVSAEAKQLGRDLTLPGVTAGSAATAMTELAKAGLSVQDSLAGARGTLQLATAAQIDVKDATQLVAGALNAFQLSGTDAVKVADLLTGAAKESQGEITDMATALGQAAAVSHQFGVSIGDTITLLTELAQAGIAGGRAGTSLRVAFLRLVNPPAAAAKALEKLNIQIRDANGNLRVDVFTQIIDAMKGYTKAQQDATLATIFGSDAIRTAAILGNKGALQFLQTSAAVNEMGLAQEQAAARTQGLQGSAENLKNQVSGLGLTIGETTKGPLKVFVDFLADRVSDVNVIADASVNAGKAVGKAGRDAAESAPFWDRWGSSVGNAAKKFALFGNTTVGPLVLTAAAIKKLGLAQEENIKKTDEWGNAIDGVGGPIRELDALLLQSAADSKINTQAISENIAVLLQSAADSRIGINNIAKGFTEFPVKQIENRIAGFNAQQVRDKINHDNKQLLADLQAEQEFLIAQLKRQGVKNRPALKRALENELLGVVTEIDQIAKQAKSAADKMKSDAEAAARAAAAAASARARALLESFSVARQIQENKITAAAQTEGLQDDIKRQQELRALVLKQIAEVKKRIPLEEGRAAALAALNAILIAVRGQIKSLVAQQQKIAADQRAALIQGIDLDIQLAQITDNQAAEVRLRRQKIAVLNRELAAEAKAHGKTTIAYKTIRNQIAEETAAINEITKEQKKQNNSFAQASFEFLQAQQGFASNLLGNLIPTGATAGLVGGGSPVQQALPPLAGAAEAARRVGPTAGQGNTTNAILAAILEQLKQLNGDQRAPEAQRQRRGQNAIFDYTPGF